MSMFYKEKSNSTFYHGDSLRHRDELKRNLLKRCELLQSDMLVLKSNLHHSAASSSSSRRAVNELIHASLLLVDDLNSLSDGAHHALFSTHQQLENAVKNYMNSVSSPGSHVLSRPLYMDGNAFPLEKLIGGKSAALSRIIPILPACVPHGFTITADAFHLFMESNNLHARIHTLLTDLDVISNKQLFQSRTREIRELIINASVPETVVDEIAKCAGETPGVSEQHGWAVRSSCVGEDGLKSFAGLFDSMLNTPTGKLEEAYKNVLAGRFTDRAVYYRNACGFKEVDTPMAVLFMPMVQARSAGVLYTRDPRDGNADHMLINSVWGLAADLMGGRMQGDIFLADRSNPGALLQQSAIEKKELLGYSSEGKLELAPVADNMKSAPSLSAENVAHLVQIGLKIEDHFGTPQDIEWVIDDNGEVMIVQTRRLLVKDIMERAGGRQTSTGELLLEGGPPVFPGWGEGAVYSAKDTTEFLEVPSGAILVSANAAPEILQVLPHIAGLIVEEKNPPSMLAARVQNFGLPCIFNAHGALEQLKEGSRIILDAAMCKVFRAIDEPAQHFEAHHEIDGDTPLHDLVFYHTIPSPLEPAQCKSLNDLIHLVHINASSFDSVSGRQKK